MRWRAQENPSQAVVDRVVGWLVDSVAQDPYRTARCIVPTIDEFSTPADHQYSWEVVLPFGSRPGWHVACKYAIDAEARVVTCWILGEFRESNFAG